MDLGQHLCIRLTEDRVIALTEVDRRAVARAILDIAKRVPLLAFGLADTHLHGECLGDERLANEIGRRIGGSLCRILQLPVGFKALPPRPIKDVWHLGNCFRYVHTQAANHGVQWERWYEATSLPDLLGLRPRGSFLLERMRQHLPRTRNIDLLSWLGVPGFGPGHGTPQEILDAVLAAAALPRLRGFSRESNAVRVAMLALLEGTLSIAEEAALLGASPRTISRLRDATPDPELVRAAALHLGLREAIRGRGDTSRSLGS